MSAQSGPPAGGISSAIASGSAFGSADQSGGGKVIGFLIPYHSGDAGIFGLLDFSKGISGLSIEPILGGFGLESLTIIGGFDAFSGIEFGAPDGGGSGGATDDGGGAFEASANESPFSLSVGSMPPMGDMHDMANSQLGQLSTPNISGGAEIGGGGGMGIGD